MKKRTISLFLALVLLLSLLPLQVFAAGKIGSVTVDGITTEYTSISEIIKAINKEGNIEVHMMADWEGGGLITINGSGNVTIHMHGYKIDREKISKGDDNEVFYLNNGAKLKVIGSEEGDTTQTHSVKYYNANDSNQPVAVPELIIGGTITGGYTNGWGPAIEMQKNNTVELVNVTVVGNKVDTSLTGGYGHGGAVRMGGDNCTLIMDHSRICYNYATKNGGAIRAEKGDNYQVIMNNNSRIDHNYAGRSGGAIESDGSLLIDGDGTGVIDYNTCKGYNNDGGGAIDIYQDGKNSAIKNLTIENNTTLSSQGGGVCFNGEGNTSSNCVVRFNRADGNSSQGGGVYINKNNNSIADCVITGNTAKTGDGVYVSGTTLILGGKLDIRGNTKTNLYLDGNSYITPSLNNTSTIGITVANASNASNGRKLSASDGTYSPFCYTYDNDSQYGFKWYNENTAGDDKYRYLYLVSAADADKAPETVTSVDDTTLAPDTALEAGVYKVGEMEYPMIKTWFSDPSANDAVSDYDAICFYSDGYFMGEPTEYNVHLATMSHALTMAGFYTNLGNVNTDLYDNQAQTTRYNNKHAHVRQLLANIGCEDESIYVNQYNLEKPGTDTIGVAIAHKTLKDPVGNDTDKILVPVVVRGSGYEAEWASNVTLDAEGEAGGFATAAGIVKSELAQYITGYGLAGKNIIFWVVGYSRAGATANIVAKRLVEEEKTVFCYTFEAAQGGVDAAETRTDKEAYYCIHNIVNAADAVPMVAPTEMGFKRYGVDHYVPGTAAGNVTSSVVSVSRGTENNKTVTTYADNKPLSVNSADYKALRAKMLPQSKAFNPYVIFDDYFTTAEINWATSQLPLYSKPFNNPVSSDMGVENYLTDLMATLQNWKIENRAWYTENFVLRGTDDKTTKYNKSFQGALRDLVRMVYGKTPAQTKQILEDVKSVMNGVGLFGSYVNAWDLYKLYTDVIQDWYNKKHDEKLKWLDWVWEVLQKTGVFENFTDEEIDDLKTDWPIIGDTLLTFISKDYVENAISAGYAKNDGNAAKRQRMGTLLYNYQRILNNHYAETVMAWLRASDSYYDGETAFYLITKPEILAAPAGVAVGSIKKTLSDGATTLVSGEQVVHLDVADTKGEAIYYTVQKEGDAASAEAVYANGIKLEPGTDTTTTYTIRTYAISYGKVSPTASYRVTVVNAPIVVGHSLTADGSIFDNAYLEIPDTYKGATVTLTVKDAEGKKANTDYKVDEKSLTKNGYRFSVGVPAKNMLDEITLTMQKDGATVPLYLGGKTESSITYSVKGYLEDTIKASTNENLTALCKAMFDYGTSAQLHFGYRKEGGDVVWKNEGALSGVTLDKVKAYKPKITDGSTASFYGGSVITRSETVIRLYFELNDEAGDTAYTLDVTGPEEVTKGETYQLKQYKETNIYYVDIANIPAKNLCDPFTVTLTNGKDKTTVSDYSVYSYVWQVLTNHKDADDTDTVLTLAKALYLYGEAAKTYFASLNKTNG